MSRARAKPGRTLSNRPPEGEAWCWMTRTMVGSITFRALGIHARRILDALLYEHMSNGGAENGNLGATYEQLERWGVTAADVRKGYAELYTTGFVRQTVQGLAAEGGGTPSRYALTWLPTGSGQQAKAPTHEWLAVAQNLGRTGVGSVSAARKWLREEVSQHARGSRKLASHVQVGSPLKREAS